jgi:hypothetical protein
VRPGDGSRRACSRLGDRGGAEHDTEFRRTARLAIVAGGTWGRGPRKPRLGAHANRGWLLPDRLSFATSPEPRIAFPRAPPSASASARVGARVGASVSASVSVSANTDHSLRPKHQVIAQTSSSFRSRRAAVLDSM